MAINVPKWIRAFDTVHTPSDGNASSTLTRGTTMSSLVRCPIKSLSPSLGWACLIVPALNPVWNGTGDHAQYPLLPNACRVLTGWCLESLQSWSRRTSSHKGILYLQQIHPALVDHVPYRNSTYHINITLSTLRHRYSLKGGCTDRVLVIIINAF